MDDDKDFLVSKWWENSIIDMKPGSIHFRGSSIEELMETQSFTQMIAFLVLGRKYTELETRLLDLALVMSVDHGPQAPSIAISRMAATCGIGINNVLGTAVNVLGDNHGGAAQGCAELFYLIESELKNGQNLAQAVEQGLASYRKEHGRVIPGYGHRFHKERDPRALKTIEIIDDYTKKGQTKGLFKDIAIEVQTQISTKQTIPLNVDGACAIIYCELRIPPTLCRGLFCLSRSVGILAHAWEEMQSGIKNKGPIPKHIIPLYSEKKESDD